MGEVAWPSKIRRYWRGQGGAAALELALWMGLLIVPLMNVMDVGLYLFKRVQIENAAQMAAQAAWAVCPDSSAQRPVTTQCSPGGGTLEDYIRGVAQAATSLATAVTLDAPVVKYYCLNDSNVLEPVATAPTAAPSDCSSVSSATPSPAPGEYLEVTATYDYSPMFSALSVAGAFTTPISYTARARID